MKNSKSNKTFHTDNTKFGMGDYYGTAIKQKVGRIREDQVGFENVSNKKLGKPPKSLA